MQSSFITKKTLENFFKTRSRKLAETNDSAATQGHTRAVPKQLQLFALVPPLLQSAINNDAARSTIVGHRWTYSLPLGDPPLPLWKIHPLEQTRFGQSQRKLTESSTPLPPTRTRILHTQKNGNGWGVGNTPEASTR